MKRHLRCAEQQVSPSNLTKYCPCREQMTSVIDPRHIWNVIYNAQSKRCHPPTSPITAPPTKNYIPKFQRNFPKTGKSSLAMHGATDVTLQPHQYCACHAKWHSKISQKWCHPPTSQNIAPATTNDLDDWSSSHIMKRHWQCAEQKMSPSNLTNYCACHEKLHSEISKKFSPPTSPNIAHATQNDTPKFHRNDVTLQPHQLLRLPQKKQNFKEIFRKQVNRHLQCAEQQMSPSNLTKYCACHAKWHSKISEKFSEKRWNVFYNAGTIGPWSETIPSMIRDWSEHDETVSPQPASQPRLPFGLTTNSLYMENTTISHFGYHSKLHKLYCARHEKWHLNFSKHCTSQSDTVTLLNYYWSITWLYYYLTLLLLDDSITWLFYYLAILSLGDSITWRFHYLAILLLEDSITCRSITWRFYYLAILLIDDSITWRFFYLAILLLGDSSTWRFYYLTLFYLTLYYLPILLLEDSITWRSITWRFYHSIEDSITLRSITWRFYYLAIPLLEDSITWRSITWRF